MTAIEAITKMLQTYLDLKINEKVTVATYFHSTRVPPVPLIQYIKRLEDYLKCSQECFILALIYLERISSDDNGFAINMYCIHRLLLAAIVVAAKFFDDTYYKNSYYSRVGGISTSELNILELQFLILLDFKLFVSKEEFEAFRKNLMQFRENPELINN